MGIFGRKRQKREQVIDLRSLRCPQCHGTHTELGWIDRVTSTSGHWCDDCGCSWKSTDGSVAGIPSAR